MKSAALAVLAALVFAAPAAAAKKPDLVVGSGTASATGNTITGSFTIRNKGGRKAVASSAVLMIGSPGYIDQPVGTAQVKAIKKGKKRTVTVTGEFPGDLKPKSWGITACADPDGFVQERSETNNCRKVGDAVLKAPPATAAPATPGGPVEYAKEQPFQLESGQSSYWAVIPPGYDETHNTPTRLLVWLHGCGGDSGGDIYTIAPTNGRNYIAITIGGRDGGCWDTSQDVPKVLAAIANVKTHFNIDARRVVIGGFSSGGDLAYPTAFYNSNMFAGVLAVGTLPFRDTGSTQAASIAAASFKFHVVHLAHTSDEIYPIESVRQETDALTAAGFPTERVERPGAHFDDQTDLNLQAVLLPHMADDWLSP